MTRYEFQRALRRYYARTGDDDHRNAVDEILPRLSDASFTELAILAITDLAQNEYRAIVREAEEEAKRRRDEAARLTMTRRPAIGEMKVNEFGEKELVHDAFTVSAANAIRHVAGKTFSYGPGPECKVTWGEATVEQHKLRIAYMMTKISGHRADIDRHTQAIRDIESVPGAKCLNDVLKATA